MNHILYQAPEIKSKVKVNPPSFYKWCHRSSGGIGSGLGCSWLGYKWQSLSCVWRMISGGQGVGWQIKGDEKLERIVISPQGLRELLGRAEGTVWVLTFGGSFQKVVRWDKLGFWRFSERELQGSQNGPGCRGSSVSSPGFFSLLPTFHFGFINVLHDVS